jgi:asparagine synthase (glutamine-hydrolysing)
MCGIAGAYGQPDGALLAPGMLTRLRHRGPDAQGWVTVGDDWAPTQLAHARLSIIDLSTAADQPLRRGRYTLVYNGELYNFRELRRQLEGSGVRFSTTSDTEVVLEAWVRWGADCLSRFRGMFAFALHNAETGELVLARDPFGIKPLYVLPRGDGMLFASEMQAIVSVVGDELSVDATAMVASMLYYWIPEEHCAISGMYKVRPGTYETWRPDGSHSVGRYWSSRDEASSAQRSPQPDLAQTLQESVAAHMVADVPVATFLSGGLDSSIITALASRMQPGLDAYTIKFRDEDMRLEAMPDDARHAQSLAGKLDIRLHTLEIEPDIVDLLPRMVRVLDEPIGDPAAINTLLMCEAARDSGVKVLLSGMGADEMFGGYRKHLACQVAARYRHLPRGLREGVVEPAVRRAPVMAGGRGLRTVRWAHRFLDFANLDEEQAFRRSYTLYDPPELAGMLPADMARGVDSLVAEHAATYYDNDLADYIDRMCLADTRLFLSGLNLAYTDRSSMAASTEVRVPFVDVEVFRSAFSLPGRDKVRGRTQKWELKRVAERWLPRDIIYRPKASFGAPLRSWVTHDLKDVIDDLLVRGELVECGLLRGADLGRMTEEQRSGRRDVSKQLWQLLTLELWYREMRGQGVKGL